MGIDKDRESPGQSHPWTYSDYRIHEKEDSSVTQTNDSTEKHLVSGSVRVSANNCQETPGSEELGEDSDEEKPETERQIELRLQTSVEGKRYVSEINEINKDNDKMVERISDKDSRNDMSASNNDEIRVRTTAFSVADILDPNKFVGCHNVARVWHPWLRDEGVRDYSRSNLEKERDSKGL